MMQNYLDSEPTISERIAMGGTHRDVVYKEFKKDSESRQTELLKDVKSMERELEVKKK
jgi:hypothetical protein